MLALYVIPSGPRRFLEVYSPDTSYRLLDRALFYLHQIHQLPSAVDTAHTFSYLYYLIIVSIYFICFAVTFLPSPGPLSPTPCPPTAASSTCSKALNPVFVLALLSNHI